MFGERCVWRRVGGVEGRRRREGLKICCGVFGVVVVDEARNIDVVLGLEQGCREFSELREVGGTGGGEEVFLATKGLEGRGICVVWEKRDE